MRSSFQSFLSFWVAVALASCVTSACNAPSGEASKKVSPHSSANLNGNVTSKADVIYQAFDMRFRDIKTQLPDRLSSLLFLLVKP
jgi:hypothetical protein